MATLITDENRGKPPHIPMRVKWETEVYDKDGKLTDRKSGENSLVAGFAFKIWSFMVANDAAFTEHDITNTIRVGYSAYPGGAATCGLIVGNVLTANATGFGIVVGTNNTAVTADDYKLNTITAHGTGANQLYYYSCYCNDIVTDATTANMRIDRVMSNTSGGLITIKELGIYGLDAGPYSWCLCRDIIGDPGTDIANGSYMLVKYTITVTEA